MEETRFNDLGSDFDDLFDNDGAVTVENLDKKNDTDPIEIPDSSEPESDADYGVIEENYKPTKTSNEPAEELDVWHQYLKDMGIENSKEIHFENENGEIETVDFDSLDKDTQLTMLKELSAPTLTDHEIEVINFLRQNNASLDEVVDFYSEQRLRDYLSYNPDQVQQPIYTIDDYSDEELYLADLKSKFPSLTDEELLSELDSAKLNEELFSKKADVIRQAYRDQEDLAWEEQMYAEQMRYEQLQQNITNAVLNFTEISIDPDPNSEDWRGIEIEDGDRQQILAYLLDQDQEGKSQLVRDIEDPNELIKLSWYKLYGDDTFKHITTYWKGLLKDARRENARLAKQVEKYKNGTNTVVSPVSEKKTNGLTNKGFSLGNGWDDLL